MNEAIQSIINSQRIKDISQLKNEIFVVLYLYDGKFIGNANYDCIGTSDCVQFPQPDIIISNCKKLGTNSILLLHNHPYYRRLETFFLKEYDPTPSIRDIASTQIFSEIAEKNGINILDHIIVCGNCSYFSFTENNLLKAVGICA